MVVVQRFWGKVLLDYGDRPHNTLECGVLALGTQLAIELVCVPSLSLACMRTLLVGELQQNAAVPRESRMPLLDRETLT